MGVCDVSACLCLLKGLGRGNAATLLLVTKMKLFLPPIAVLSWELLHCILPLSQGVWELLNYSMSMRTNRWSCPSPGTQSVLPLPPFSAPTGQSGEGSFWTWPNHFCLFRITHPLTFISVLDKLLQSNIEWHSAISKIYCGARFSNNTVCAGGLKILSHVGFWHVGNAFPPPQICNMSSQHDFLIGGKFCSPNWLWFQKSGFTT